MAALVVGEHLRQAGLEDRVTISSAGTGPWHIGDPADPRTAKVLAEHGYPTEHVAAQVGDQHLEADLLVAMDAGHLRVVRDAVDDPERVRMLRSFDPDAEDRSEVPDPYFDDKRGFDIVLSMIESAVPGLLDWVRERV